jgi:hypothetical protein
MAMIVFYRRLTAKQVREVTKTVADFFATHPRRRVCRTNIQGGKTFHRATFRQEIRACSRS